MDLLRLPGPLRRLLLSQQSHFHRHVSTASALSSAPPDPLPTLTLSPSTLNSYLDTPPPTPANLTAANAFFTRTPPLLLYSTPTFRHLPPSPHPEVAFLGRSNVGKSSLLNALFNRVHSRDVAHVSKHAGRTRTLNGYGIGTFLSAGPAPISSPSSGASSKKSSRKPDDPKLERWKTLGPNGLICVDMPGYGRVADAAWGEEALKFFRNRRQLRRTFVLIDAEHGVKKTDLALLTLLRREGVAVRVLVSKVDKILYPRATPFAPVEMERRLRRLREVTEEIRGQVEEASGERDWLGDILCFSSRKTWEVEGMREKPRMGIGEVRWAVLEACGMEGPMR